MHSRIYRRSLLTAMAGAALFASGCSSSSPANSASGITALSLSATTATVTPNGATTAVIATVARPISDVNQLALSVSGAPAGLSVSIVQPYYGTYGTLNLSSAASTIPGVYALTVTAADGIATVTANLSVTVTAVDALTITPAAASLALTQNTTPGSDAFSIVRSFGNTNAITVAASGLPTGLTASFTQPGTGSSGSVTFTNAATPATAGTYAVTLTASDGTTSATAAVSVTVEPIVTISNTTNTSQGIGGSLQEFMSTGFQPSTYDNQFFVNFPSTTQLSALNASHIRLQPVQGAIPWSANSSPQQASDWSFTALDETVQPLLNSGDKSPIFQIAIAPAFLCNSSGQFIFNTTNLQLLASYAQNLVRYYNTGGFTWGGQHFQSASSNPITWWAIFNEPNLNGLTAAQYVQIYNTLVPAMLAVDANLKFSALELSDYAGQPQLYLPQMVLPAASGGINAQINAVATHFYGTCNETTTDASVFNAITQFTSDVTYIRTQLATRSDLANTPVWVTENNVNSDYNSSTGYSNCNPTQLFVSDARGTSAFFAAWRPLVFSQLGKAGNQALYHFLYEGSNQYGEVNSGSAVPYLSYWVDKYLQQTFPWNGTTTGPSILTTTSTEPTPTIETLAVRNADNSVSLMVVDYAVHSTTDDNGAGAPRTVQVNISALGSFSTGSQVVLNASTNTQTGPTATTFTVTPTITVTLSGYGVALIKLTP